MSKSFGLILACALWLPAQEAAPPEKKPVFKAKATPAERARELMDRAIETVTAASQQTQAAALLHLAEVYPDRRKALELFEQAFAAAGSLPESGANMQAQVVSVLAPVNIERAIDMVRTMPPPASTGGRDFRRQALDPLVSELLRKKDVDRAIDLVTAFGVDGEFAFDTAGHIAKTLAPDDPRRTALFAAATTSYSNRPKGGFNTYVAAEWKFMPPQMVDSAVAAILKTALDTKEEGTFQQTISSVKGAVSFNSRADSELFNVMHIVAQINPKRASEILDARSELREALKQFPEGVASMKGETDQGISTNTRSGGKGPAQPSPEVMQKMREEALSESKIQEAAAAMSTSVDKALTLIADIPVAERRAQALGMAARSAATKDATTARAALSRCMKELSEIKDAQVGIWLDVAEAAHKIQDEETARMALDRALSKALASLKSDLDPKSPNLALREFWPSTQETRRIAHRATSLYGMDAEYILPRITDNDLNIIATVELARALLKKPLRADDVSVHKK